MMTVVKSLDAWTAGELLAEVATGSAGDAASLRTQGMTETGARPVAALGQWDDEEDWQRFFL
jgi:hypothetical protein